MQSCTHSIAQFYEYNLATYPQMVSVALPYHSHCIAQLLYMMEALPISSYVHEGSTAYIIICTWGKHCLYHHMYMREALPISSYVHEGSTAYIIRMYMREALPIYIIICTWGKHCLYISSYVHEEALPISYVHEGSTAYIIICTWGSTAYIYHHMYTREGRIFLTALPLLYFPYYWDGLAGQTILPQEQ